MENLWFNPRTTCSESKKIVSYSEMVKLSNEVDDFDYVDEQVNGVNIRTFNYRLNIAENFYAPGSRNFRGTVYDRDTGEILALPFFKFFNIDQNLFSYYDNIKNWRIKNIYEKVDGTLIYFYKVNGLLTCRTKREYTNAFTTKSMQIVNRTIGLRRFIEDFISQGYTPMFELISAINPLVVRYNFDELVFLAVRNMNTGEVIFSDTDILPAYQNSMVSIFPIRDTFGSLRDVLDSVHNTFYTDRKDVTEGYTVVFENGEIVKVKRPQFFELFHLYDITLNDKQIVKMIFDETLDDYIPELRNNPSRFSFVESIIKSVNDTWNRRVNISKSFWENNRRLRLKDFVAKAQSELEKSQVGLAIEMYKGRGLFDPTRLREWYFRNREWRKSVHFREVEGTDV